MKKNSPTEMMRPLWSKQFSIFWLGSLLSNIGTWMQGVAEPWLVLSLSGSSFLLGVDAFAMDAPVWILTIFGGILADRADRRKVIFFFQSIQMLCPLILIFLLWTSWLHTWMIIALSLLVGITDALSMPSFQSIIPSMVEQKQIANALALNSTQFNLSRIVGPAMAALTMAHFGAIGCFSANAASYLPLLLCVYWVIPKSNRHWQTVETVHVQRPIFSEVKDIAKNKKLRGAILTVLTTSILCGPLITFCPVLIKDIFHADVSQFGGALSAFGIGGLLGALLILVLGTSVNRTKLCSLFAILYAMLVLAVSLNHSLLFLDVLLVLGGITLTASNTSANSILPYFSLDRMRGQTASLYMLAMRGGISIGNLLAGFTVSRFGVTHALFANGILAILIQLLIARKWQYAWKEEIHLELH